jgi:hypothetical protein
MVNDRSDLRFPLKAFGGKGENRKSAGNPHVMYEQRRKKPIRPMMRPDLAETGNP